MTKRNIMQDFANKYGSVDSFIEGMENGSVELFEKDPEYSEILFRFAESLYVLQEDMMKRAIAPVDSQLPIYLLMSRQESEKILKTWTFCTILYTILQNLENENIIKVIPPAERKARTLWQKAKKS